MMENDIDRVNSLWLDRIRGVRKDLDSTHKELEGARAMLCEKDIELEALKVRRGMNLVLVDQNEIEAHDRTTRELGALKDKVRRYFKTIEGPRTYESDLAYIEAKKELRAAVEDKPKEGESR